MTSRNRKYELKMVDGNQRRWSGWSANLKDARKRAAEKSARHGFPIEIRKGPGAGYGDLIERVEIGIEPSEATPPQLIAALINEVDAALSEMPTEADKRNGVGIDAAAVERVECNLTRMLEMLGE